MSMRARGSLVLALLALGLGMLALAGPALAADPVVDAAGDLACSPTDPNFNFGNGTPNAIFPADNCLQQPVSNLIAGSLPTAFLTLGDNQYGTANGSNNGTLAQYQQVYGPTFGRANSVVYPALGDGDYGDTGTPDNSGFLQYFTSTGVFSRIQQQGGNDANLTSQVYYSYNLGSWDIIALNSQCAAIKSPTKGAGGCGIGSNEEKWLKADLAAHPGVCTLAYWHVPRWNSGTLGNRTDSAAFWTDLYNAHADVVLNAHGNNHYERFVPQNPLGQPDPTGIREFIVSDGGYSHGKPPATPGDPSTSVVADYTTMGVLQLVLHPGSYSWQFLPGGVGSFRDSGTGTCNSNQQPPPPPTFPSAAVLDSFVQAPGPLSPNWQSPALQDPGTVKVPGSGSTGGSTGASSATWTHTQFAANQEAYMVVPTLPAAGGFLQVGGRVSSLTGSKVSLYFLRVTPSKNLWDLRKKLNGAGSTSMGTFTAPFAAGDSMGIKLNGSTITAYHEAGTGSWTSVGSVTDTSITGGGYLTFTLGDTTARGGAFGGGNSS
jgi:acid phosphatase type 7